MWIYSRIINICLIETVTIEELLERMESEPDILPNVNHGKLEYSGYIIKNHPKCRILQNIIGPD